jgi:hypothetical protein
MRGETPILPAMDDFRTQLKTVIDAMAETGIEPVFLVIDLWGAEDVKRNQGAESLQKFRDATMDAMTNACGGEAFAYGEYRVVGILPGPTRLKTFALIQKLQRALPLLGQSFDCILHPEFDVLEYDATSGVAGVVAQLVKLPAQRLEAA